MSFPSEVSRLTDIGKYPAAVDLCSSAARQLLDAMGVGRERTHALGRHYLWIAKSLFTGPQTFQRTTRTSAPISVSGEGNVPDRHLVLTERVADKRRGGLRWYRDTAFTYEVAEVADTSGQAQPQALAAVEDVEGIFAPLPTRESGPQATRFAELLGPLAMAAGFEMRTTQSPLEELLYSARVEVVPQATTRTLSVAA